jgi:thymidylate synthase (FAD)
MSQVSLVHRTEGAEDLIVYMARVSNPSSQKENKNGERLLKYLIKHKHWSPFEMASMCVEIETSRSISSQLLRHRSFQYQEYSQRYAAVLDKPETPNLRRQDVKNRQNSIDDLDPFLKQNLQLNAQRLFTQAHLLYEEMLEHGVAKECAREVLPLASRTRLYMHGTLRSWIHYIDVRASVETQLEHRQIAEKIKRIMYEQFPTISAAAFD